MPDADAVRELLSEVEALMSQAEDDRKTALARIERLGQERRGLKLTLERLEGRPAAPPRTLPSSVISMTGSSQAPEPNGDAKVVLVEDWTQLDRTSAVRKAFVEIGGPANRNDVARVLYRHGRKDKLDDISAAFSYLRRTNAAQRQADGKWLLLALGAVAVGAIAFGAASQGGASGS